MEQKPRVFISYAREDGETFATALRQRLEREQPEISLWQDRARLEGGIGWWKQITAALDVVQFLVLVMTPAAMKSPVARKEWRYARQRGVCVYPVKGVPDEDIDRGGLPQWMQKSHFVDLKHEWDTFIHHLKSPCRANRVPFMAPDLPEGFVERPALVDALLAQVLDGSRQDPVAITTALRGAGGLGKTTIAAALCHCDEVLTAFDDGILWVTIGQTPNLQEALAKLYAAVTGGRPGFFDEEDAAFHLAEALEDKSCLIVLDDVWDLAHLRPFMRGGAGCTRLITTRHFEVASEARRIEVDKMTSGEAVMMLSNRVAIVASSELASLRAIALRLGEWPLLLGLANAALRRRIERGDTVDGAIRYLNRQMDDRGVVAFDQRNASSREQAVTRTIDLSLDELAVDERDRYLQLAAFPEDADVPVAIAALLWGCSNAEAEELVQQFDDLSLLSFSLQSGSFRLHDVMRGYILARLVYAPALHAKLADACGDPFRLSEPYAWVWLAYHLFQAGRRDRLRALLLDGEWLEAKLGATNVTSLVADFAYMSDDSTLSTLQGALSLSAHVLAVDKSQLSGQLLGRLPQGAAPELDALRAQLSGWRQSTWLRPLEPSLIEPGGPLLYTLTGHIGSVRSVALSPDGRRAVSGADDMTVRVWDLESGTEINRLVGHTDWIRAVAVSPDGQIAISAADDQTVRIWDLQSGTLNRVVNAIGDWPKALAITSDGKQLLLAGDSHNVQLRDLANDKSSTALRGHRGIVNSVVTLPDGEHAITASDDRTLRLWRLESGKEECVMTGHTARIVGLSIASDTACIVSGARDDTLREWTVDMRTNTVTARVITTDAHSVRAISLTPDAQHVVSGADDGSISVWSTQSGAKLRTLEGHTDSINCLAVTSDGRRIVSASGDSTLKVWQWEMPQQRTVRKGHADRVRALTTDGDGGLAVSTSDDHKLKVWSVEAREEIFAIRARSHWPVALCVARRAIVSAAGDGSIEILDLDSGARRVVLHGHTDRIRAVLVTRDRQRIVSSSDDRTIRVWDFETGELERAIPTERHWTRALAVSADGGLLVSGSDDQTLKVWDTESGAEVRTVRAHQARVNAVALSRDARFVVSGSDDRLVKLWHVGSGELAMAFDGHSAKVNAVALDADDRLLYSASDDFTVKVWSLLSGLPLASYTGDSPILTCAVCQGGTVLAGDQNGRMHFLSLEWVHDGRHSVGGNDAS